MFIYEFEKTAFKIPSFKPPAAFKGLAQHGASLEKGHAVKGMPSVTSMTQGAKFKAPKIPSPQGGA